MDLPASGTPETNVRICSHFQGISGLQLYIDIYDSYLLFTYNYTVQYTSVNFILKFAQVFFVKWLNKWCLWNTQAQDQKHQKQEVKPPFFSAGFLIWWGFCQQARFNGFLSCTWHRGGVELRDLDGFCAQECPKILHPGACLTFVGNWIIIPKPCQISMRYLEGWACLKKYDNNNNLKRLSRQHTHIKLRVNWNCVACVWWSSLKVAIRLGLSPPKCDRLQSKFHPLRLSYFGLDVPRIYWGIDGITAYTAFGTGSVSSSYVQWHSKFFPPRKEQKSRQICLAHLRWFCQGSIWRYSTRFRFETSISYHLLRKWR